MSLLGLPRWLSLQRSPLHCRSLMPVLRRSPGEGNGNPLQYSCLGNLTDRDWQLTVHGSQSEARQWLKHHHVTPAPGTACCWACTVLLAAALLSVAVSSSCPATVCEWRELPLWFSTFPATTAIALLDQWRSQRPWRVSGEKALLLFLIFPSSFTLDTHWLFQQFCPGDRCIGFMVP